VSAATRHAAALTLLLSSALLLATTSATAAPIGPSDGATQIPFGCTPVPIEGTVGWAVANQARETNSQLFGAAAYAERVVFPRMDLKSAGGWKNMDGGSGSFSLEVNAINGAAYVPSKETGGECPSEYGYLMHRVDLYASSSALSAKFGPVGLFYVSSITGSSYATRVGSGFLPYAYGLGAGFAGYLAPFQLKSLNYQDDLKSRATDYIAGAQIDLYTLGSARFGYIGSQGLFAQANGKIVKLFGTAALKDFKDVSAADYLRAGLDRQMWGKSDEALAVGATSVFYRRLNYKPPTQFLNGVTQLDELSSEFQTVHFEQVGLGGMVDIKAAGAPFAEEPFLHQALFGLHTPAFPFIRDLMVDGIDPSELAVFERDGFYLDGSATVGMIRLPSLPYYGVEGGPKFSANLEAVAWMPMEDVMRIAIAWSLRYNTADLLDAFPYAQDAVNHTFSIRIN
jgi:hypothetical protein